MYHTGNMLDVVFGEGSHPSTVAAKIATTRRTTAGAMMDGFLDYRTTAPPGQDTVINDEDQHRAEKVSVAMNLED